MLNLGCSKFRSPTIIVDTESLTSNHGSVKTHFGCFNPHQPTIFLREPIVFIDRVQYCCKLHLPLRWLIPNFGWLTSSTGWILTSYLEDPHVWRLIINYSSYTAIILLWLIEGSLEVKLPTMWTDEKAEVRRARREQSQRGEKSEEKRSKKEDAGVRKGRKVAKQCVFSMFCGSGGSKSRLAKAAGAETSGEMRN